MDGHTADCLLKGHLLVVGHGFAKVVQLLLKFVSVAHLRTTHFLFSLLFKSRLFVCVEAGNQLFEFWGDLHDPEMRLLELLLVYNKAFVVLKAGEVSDSFGQEVVFAGQAH